jgi:hypothetical protein
MMRSFLQFLRYLLKRDLVIFGRYNDVLAYPLLIASYIVPVRQYRILPFGFLHCIPRGKPACHLLMLLGTTPAHKGLAPFGTNTVHNLFGIPKINLHFSNLFRTSSCVHCHPCRAHTLYIKNRRDSSKFKGCSSFQPLSHLENEVLRNRLLFIYSPLAAIRHIGTSEAD